MADIRLFSIAVLASLMSCAAPVRYALMDRPAYSLTVWLEKDPLLERDDALKGCNEWRSKGVVCRLTEREDEADVRVSTADGECLTDEDGYRTLAIAYRDGRIVFNSRCFRKSGGYDRHMFRSVMTHELGHEIGIWQHIPKDCAKDTPRHSNGQPVCGIAVMNKTYDDDVWFVTVIDAMAFDLRDQEQSSLRPLDSGQSVRGPKLEMPYCIYRAK